MTACAASVWAGSYDWPQGLSYGSGSSDPGWGGTRFDDSGSDYGSHPGYRERPRIADPGSRYWYRRDPDGGGATRSGFPTYTQDDQSQGYWSEAPWEDKPRRPQAQGFDPGEYQGARGAADHRSGYGYQGYSFKGDSQAQDVAVPGYRFRGDPVPESGPGTAYFDGRYHYRPLSQAERDRSGQGAWRPLPSRRQDPPSLDRTPGAAYGFEAGLGGGE